MAHQDNVKWIIPPSLANTVKKFNKHCTIALEEKMPVLVHGATGVGKSLFLKLYIQAYERKFIKVGDDEVAWHNCSHFSGGDPRIAAVELFGIENGVVNNIKKRNGLLSNNRVKLLILDEIGELPLEVQAMLLTYIETGKYRPIGSSRLIKADSKPSIIGSTNNIDALRRDFFQRFLHFRLPSLHERRHDILYYYACRFPELISSLTAKEMLSLIAYHWPGNIRELERLGLLIKRNREPEFKEDVEIDKKREPSDMVIKDYVNEILNSINFADAFSEVMSEESDDEDEGAYANLPVRRDVIDTKKIASIINHYIPKRGRVKGEYSLSTFEMSHIGFDDSKREIQKLSQYEPFDDMYRAYQTYCSLFLQDEHQNSNSLKPRLFTTKLPPLPEEFWDIRKKMLKGVDIQVLKGLANLKDDDVDKRIHAIPIGKEREGFFMELLQRNPGNPFLEILLNHNDKVQAVEGVDLSGYTRDNLLSVYYKQILKKTGGNKTAAARFMGIRESSLRGYVRELGLGE